MHDVDRLVVVVFCEVVELSAMCFNTNEFRGMEVTSDSNEAANEFAKGGTLTEVDISEAFEHPVDI